MILPILLAAIASPTSVNRFDLFCEGTSRYLNASTLTDKNEPFYREYRIDLVKKLYCVDDCSTGPADIVEVNDRVIVFDKGYAGDPIYGTKGLYIDRVAGEYHGYDFPVGFSAGSIDQKGKCRLAEFKEFPTVHRQF